MLHTRTLVAWMLAAMLVVVSSAARAGDASSADIEALKREIEDLRKKVAASGAPARSSVDRALDSKYGPNASVTTKNGKLVISGLVQVWYYSIQNDNEGLFQDNDINGIADTNEAADNDSFRIRRTELKFNMDIHENITAVVMIDPAREATSFPGFPDNQANTGGVFKTVNQISPEFDDANGPGVGSSASVSRVQTGAGAVPRLLQDAYINYHGVIPHHDFQIGQFKPWIGEEGIRSSAQLDFVERSMIGQLGDVRDLGASVHGTWWDDRVQYWFGLFDGAGNYFGSAGQQQNRSDDNDAKDFNGRILVRPLWKNETWGSIELGYSFEGGTHGEASGRDPVDTPLNGLNRNETAALRHNIWASYLPGGPVRGWWIRGEWGYVKDRHAPTTVIDVQGNANAGNGNVQTNGKPFSVQGWYIATGYKISDSCFKDSAPGWLKPFEFALRYDTMKNVAVADLANNSQTDTFRTEVFTGGINYYIKGHNAKIQANYNAVSHEDGDDNAGNRTFHKVRNDSFVVNFQVAF